MLSSLVALHKCIFLLTESYLVTDHKDLVARANSVDKSAYSNLERLFQVERPNLVIILCYIPTWHVFSTSKALHSTSSVFP